MAIKSSIKPNLYKDSVSLMRISQIAVSRTGVQRATLLMGTGGNKEFLSQAGLMSSQLEGAKPGDIMIVVEDESADKIEVAEREIHSLIAGEEPKAGADEQASKAPPRSIAPPREDSWRVAFPPRRNPRPQRDRTIRSDPGFGRRG